MSTWRLASIEWWCVVMPAVDTGSLLKKLAGHLVDHILERGNVSFDAKTKRLTFTRRIEYKRKHYGSQGDNTAIFREPKSVSVLLQDVADLFATLGGRLEVVRCRITIKQRQPLHKQRWYEDLAQNQALLIISRLVALGIPQDKLTANVVESVEEGHCIIFHPET